MLSVVVQKQREIKRRQMTLASILKITVPESDFLLNCTHRLRICDTTETHQLLNKSQHFITTKKVASFNHQLSY